MGVPLQHGQSAKETVGRVGGGRPEGHVGDPTHRRGVVTMDDGADVMKGHKVG